MNSDTEAQYKKLKEKRDSYVRILNIAKNDSEFYQRRIEDIDREMLEIDVQEKVKK